MRNKVVLCICLIFALSVLIVNVHATGFLNEIIQQGNGFSSGASDSSGIGSSVKSFVNNKIRTSVVAIGNLIFAAVTVVLGVKYIWSSAEGKAQVMETLPGFIAAVMFFYLGSEIVDFLYNDSGSVGKLLAGSSNWNSVAGYVIYVINTFVYYAAFGGIVFIGLKYMFASAEGRASMKTSMGALVIGMVFVFMASRIVNFIIDVGESVI